MTGLRGGRGDALLVDGMPGNAVAEAWAPGIHGPSYAVDDQTAFSVSDGTTEIVSQGHWRQLPG